MNQNKLTRLVLSIATSLSHGLLLAWVLTYPQASLDQLFAAASIGGLLLFAHYASDKIIGKSIFFIHSYIEGILLFLMTMAAFRLGDHYLGLTKVSLRTEIFLFTVAGLTGTAYVWVMRRIMPSK